MCTYINRLEQHSHTLRRDDFVPGLVGRNDQLNDLENWITKRSTKSPMVITVTGKSGVGKTRLVTEIYEKPSTKRHFQVQAWATCAPNLSASNIMKLILLRLKKGNVAPPKDEVRDDKLKKKLKNKKYLLVIDGEVSSTEWNIILNVLPKDNGESRVVRITQEKNTEAPTAGFVQDKIELHHLENKGTTAELFCTTLLMDKKVGEQYDGLVEKAVKEEYAQPIFDATGGLPLAVVLLSGLLRTKEYPGEWENVFDHLKGRSNEWKRLHIILSMCLDDLPHDLKSCFLYFAGFPVSTLVRARTLVCMWMAEGFLRPKEGKTMEKVGECYLHELIHRRLVNLPPLENAGPGDQRVTVQTRVHDFLVLEAQEANFVEIHGGDDVPTLSTARRLSLQNHRDKYAALTEPLPKLRSILSSFENENSPGTTEIREETRKFFGACRPFMCKTDSNSKDHMRKLLQGSQFLRVISLDGLQIGNKLPSEIGNVVHLQFLGITSCSLDEIPPSVGNLTRLQTLDVRGTSVLRLPREFWRIRMLRHVFGSIVLPRRVGNLEQLQTLQAVNPDDGGGSWDITTFASMKRLQSLYIDLSGKNVQALAAIYALKLKYLVFLSIHGDEIPWDLFTRSDLPRLQVMVLKGEITRPPNGSHCVYPPTLTKLSLKKTKVAQYFIDELSHELPLLATLALFRKSYVDVRLVFTDGFQSLKELTLDAEDLQEIVIHEPACPRLVKLKIFIYSSSVRIHILNRPDIEDIIREEDKFLYDNMIK